MKRLTKTLATLAAAALATPVLAALPPAGAWEIGPSIRGRNYSVGMPTQPAPARGGGVAFDFPIAGRGQVDAMITDVGPLAGARQITMRYRIDAARGTRFVPFERPNEPATVSLYFQRRGDNWSARGRARTSGTIRSGRAVIPLAPVTVWVPGASGITARPGTYQRYDS